MKYFMIMICLMLTCFSATSQNKHTHGSETHTHDDHSQAPQDYFGSYNLSDTTYGTETIVTVNGTKRTMVTNA